MIRPGQARAPFVGDLGSGAGDDPLAGGVLQTTPGIPAFQDDFTESALKPFWRDTQMFTSGDWQFSAANDRLEGIAQNNGWDYYRYGIEGDFDHAAKFERNGASSIGFRIYNEDETILARLVETGSEINAEFTGESDVAVATSPATVWLRIVRIGTTIYYYYKVNDGDDWTLITTHTSKNMGWQVNSAMDSATNGRIHQVIFHDNSWSNQLRSKAFKWVELTDAATIAVDASLGNLFTVTLGGNRTLGNPTNSRIGQPLIFRVHQDVTGSRTLAFDTDYNFSTDLPSPVISTGSNDYDYLGFLYNESNSKWDYIAEVFGF